MSCFGCKKRNIVCHATCEDYKAFKEQAHKDYVANHDKVDYEVSGYQKQSYEKWLKKNPRKRNDWRNG